MGQFITIGHGKSINADPQRAVNEAVDEALSQLGKALPQYAYFFTTIDYDANLERQFRLSAAVARIIPLKAYGSSSVRTVIFQTAP